LWLKRLLSFIPESPASAPPLPAITTFFPQLFTGVLFGSRWIKADKQYPDFMKASFAGMGRLDYYAAKQGLKVLKRNRCYTHYQKI
jgi:hypothetical protein